LPALRLCVLEAGGNAQAYALGSLLVLLELDMGWEIVDGDVVEKVGVMWREGLGQWSGWIVVTGWNAAMKVYFDGQER
jgi:hypothetical protein